MSAGPQRGGERPRSAGVQRKSMLRGSGSAPSLRPSGPSGLAAAAASGAGASPSMSHTVSRRSANGNPVVAF